MNFLPNEYNELPKTQGNYMKLLEGENRFRVMDSAIVGYEYWTPDNKPVRLKKFPVSPPNDIREDSKVKHFWAFPVWNYNAKKIQILEITQSTIQEQIKGFIDDADWGDPKQYDIVVKRSGEGLETTYTTSPKPVSELSLEAAEAYEKINIKLEALFTGDDPFAS